MKKSSGFQVFCGDIISEVGLGLFSRVHQALGPNRKREYFAQVFSGNYAKIRVSWAFDWLSSVSGWKVMAKKNKFWAKITPNDFLPNFE